MNNNDKYTILKNRFFSNKNISWYIKEYPNAVNMFLKKSYLWRYILTEAWRKDEKCFLDNADNEIFYILQFQEYYNKIEKLNSNFCLVIYIFFNLDLIGKFNTIYDYLNHFIIFGHRENRICDIKSYKSFDLIYFINHNKHLAGICNCIYDYVFHFVNVDNNLKCTSLPPYDNNFTIVNNFSTGVMFIKFMKTIYNNKKNSTIDTMSKERSLVEQIKFNVIRRTKFVKESENESSQIILSKFDNSNSNILYHKYPFVFNKYLLKLTTPTNSPTYEIVQKININNNHINTVVHLHCFNISMFEKFYGPFFTTLKNNFSLIIVTYSKGSLNYNFNNLVLIKIQNKGMDIGAKIIAIDYISRLKIKCDYIFFLHSKSDDKKRADYYLPFFLNMSFILDSLKKKEYSGYFPPVILNGDYYQLIYNNRFIYTTNVHTDRDNRNKILFDNFCDLFGLNKNFVLFPEGNNFILSYDIASEIYKPEFYNLLNHKESFDAHWVKLYYSLNTTNIYDIYKLYKERKLYGNNIETGMGHAGLADSQIEHVFERLIFCLIQKQRGRISILPYSTVVEERTKKLENTINYSYLYGKFRISEKELIWSNINSHMGKDTLTIIACHTNSNLKIQCLIHNIAVFLPISSKVILCNSSEFKYLDLFSIIKKKFSDKLHKLEFHYIDNDCFVCHKKWYEMLKKEYSDLLRYNSFILTNDSYIYVKSKSILKNFMDKNYEMQTMLISNEIHKHYTDFLRIYNFGGVLKIFKFYEHFILNNRNVSFQEIINELEMKSHEIFNNKNGLFEEKEKININFIEPYKEQYFVNTDYPIIKVKALLGTNYDDNNLPEDFDPFVYKSLHNDLGTLTSKENLTNHFINNGIKEGRLYKKNQIKNPVIYIKKYLDKYKININVD